MSTPALRVRDLTVRFGDFTAVKSVDLDLYPGKILGIVGESGSGKSVTARSLMGLSGGTVTADEFTIGSQAENALEFTPAQWRKLRGSTVSVILQDALTALDPLRPIYREMTDDADIPRGQRLTVAAERLERFGMPEPTRRAKQRSTQLSGGMRQRVLIAQAMMGDPEIVIADEATTALDTRLTQLVLDHLVRLKNESRAVVMISHDLAQIAEVADHIIVIRGGEVVESGTNTEILQHPSHDYTRQLLRAIPHAVPRFQSLTTREQLAPPPQDSTTVPAMVATGLSKSFQSHRAVDQVSLSIPAGKTLGLVGESGSGKTTTARMLLGLTTPDEGEVFLHGRRFAPVKERHRRKLRHQLGAIYQDPLSSFDPRYTVDQILKNVLSAGKTSRSSTWNQRVRKLLDMVQLPETVARQYPQQLSGGQRQRIAIARALALNPDVLVLDEPVSALDVSVQATILDLLDEIQLNTGASYLFITHDLGVVEHMSDELAVMHQGKVVETGPTEQIFRNPQHSYTQELLAAAPDFAPAAL